MIERLRVLLLKLALSAAVFTLLVSRTGLSVFSLRPETLLVFAAVWGGDSGGGVDSSGEVELRGGDGCGGHWQRGHGCLFRHGAVRRSHSLQPHRTHRHLQTELLLSPHRPFKIFAFFLGYNKGWEQLID